MDLNYLLIWIVCISCISILIYAFRFSTSYTRGWIIAALLVLCTIILNAYIYPSIAGFIGAFFWMFLILIPLIGSNQINKLAAKQQYSQARKLSIILSWLHPADGWREQPEILQALEMGKQGKINAAITILNRHKNAQTPIGRDATATLYQMNGLWEELLIWIRINLSETVLDKDFNMLLCYLRSLGETGDLNGLLAACDRYQNTLDKINNSITQNLARLFVFSFCGQKEQVEKLFNGPLSLYSPNIRTFWLATADLAAGNETSAQEQLLTIRNNEDIRIRSAIERRLSQPIINPETVLNDDSKQILSRLVTELEHEARYSVRSDFRQKKALATFTLISLNILIFAVEVFLVGKEYILYHFDLGFFNLNPLNSEYASQFYNKLLLTLYNLGALVPEEIIQQKAWWRILTSTFLHFGFLHLFMNMIALAFLGPFVEFTLGIRRYLFTYFTAGIGSMLVVTYASVMGYSQAEFVVGASGAIMGIIGATAAIMLRGWQKEKSRIASKRLRAILFIIAFQIIFDISTPQVSFVGHTAGMIIGFLIASLLKHKWQKNK